jgi:amino acid transporter
MTVVNLNGAASGTCLVEVGTVLKLIPLFVFISAGALTLHGTGPSLRAIPPAEGSGRANILALFAFAGMEVPLGKTRLVAYLLLGMASVGLNDICG